jgi:multicomponent Na+:H+ antiporter subunit G
MTGMPLKEAFEAAFLLAGGMLFLAGTVGLLRFPDVYTRLHALTKADNLGLGLVTLSLIMQAAAWDTALKLLLIWLLVMLASTTSCHLVGRAALHMGVSPWKNS